MQRVYYNEEFYKKFWMAYDELLKEENITRLNSGERFGLLWYVEERVLGLNSNSLSRKEKNWVTPVGWLVLETTTIVCEIGGRIKYKKIIRSGDVVIVDPARLTLNFITHSPKEIWVRKDECSFKWVVDAYEVGLEKYMVGKFLPLFTVEAVNMCCLIRIKQDVIEIIERLLIDFPISE